MKLKKLKKNMALVLSVMLTMSAVVGCGKESNSSVENGKVLNVCVGGETDTIDPAMNTTSDGITLINHAFEGLMKRDEQGELTGGQAISYEVNDDETVYTFKLRDDAKWSDGKDVTSQDFVYAWQRLVDPKTGSDYNYMIEMVENASEIMNGEKDVKELGVKALDEKTFEVTLKTPVRYFLEVCAFSATFPVRQDVIEANGDKWSIEPETYVVNGPYKLQSWEHQYKMTYVQNENYYDVESLGPDTINFVLMEDQNTILSAFKNGEILFADTLPTEEIDAMKDKGLKIDTSLATYSLCVNIEKEGLDNVKVRKALSLALDRSYLVEKVARGGQIPADSFVPTGVKDADGKTQFHENANKWYDVDDVEGNIKKAKELLKEAGYENGKGLPTIELLCAPGHENMMEAVQSMWKEIGINSTISCQDWNAYVQTMKSGDYQVARHGWAATYNDPTIFLDMWVTGCGNNSANWSNEKYDSLIKKSKSITDKEEIFDLMHQAEDILGEESPIIPLYYYTDVYLKSEKLDGLYTAAGCKYFKYCTMNEQ